MWVLGRWRKLDGFVTVHSGNQIPVRAVFLLSLFSGSHCPKTTDGCRRREQEYNYYNLVLCISRMYLRVRKPRCLYLSKSQSPERF